MEHELRDLPNGNRLRGDAFYLADYTPATCVSAWSSPETFGKYIASLNRNQAWEDAGWDKSDNGWAGSNSMEDSLEMLRKGWPDGAAQVVKIRDRVLARNPIRKRALKYAIAGSTPNVPRAVSGNVLNMRADTDSRSRKRPIITIISNMSASWTISAQVLSNRAAAVAALIDQIESAGFSCEVLATATSTGYGKAKDGKPFTYSCIVTVKPSSQPVDIGRLAFGLGQASMFRRLVFADKGSDSICKNGLGSGLGCSFNKTQTEEDTYRNRYYLPSAQESKQYFVDEETTATQGVAFLVDTLKKQGCPAFAG